MIGPWESTSVNAIGEFVLAHFQWPTAIKVPLRLTLLVGLVRHICIGSLTLLVGGFISAHFDWSIGPMLLVCSRRPILIGSSRLTLLVGSYR